MSPDRASPCQYMLQKLSLDIYQSTLFMPFTHLIHGYSTRHAGDIRSESVYEKVLRNLHATPSQVIRATQVHKGDVYQAHAVDQGSVVPDVDGLVYKKDDSSLVFLSVRVADCVPLLLYEPTAQIVAAVHAGWKSTVSNIAAHVVDAMVQRGANTSEIRVSVGPHIGMCCYDVSLDRAKIFESLFLGHDVVSCSDTGWHVDIGKANVLQLIAAGILQHNIDAPPLCTSCQHDTYFSYRKDSNTTFGEMMAVIGIK